MVQVGLIVLSVLVVVTNAAVICMVIFIKQLRTFTNYFVVSLAVSDLLTGGIVLPLNVPEWAFNQVISQVLAYFLSVVLISGAGNLCAVTWDRYIAITDPFGYKDKLERYCKSILIAIWMTTILWSVIPYFWVDDTESVQQKVYVVVTLVVVFILPCLFISIAYIRMKLCLRFHSAELKKMDITNETREGARKASREGKTIKVFVVVMTCFLIGWLPFVYMNTVNYLVDKPELVPDVLGGVCLLAIAVSSFVNPILYAILKRDFKAQLRRFSRSSRVGPQSSSVDRISNPCQNSTL